MNHAKHPMSSLFNIFRRTRRQPTTVPLHGHPASAQPVPAVDGLSDSDLERLNALLPWNAFTADARGRRIGNAAWSTKRTEAQAIPDRRIVLMNERFGLSDKSVVEIGCFEGIHTIGLCRYARAVVAVDSRIDNVVKTIVRCGLYGHHPSVFQCDVEAAQDHSMLAADLMHHVGVLYHLRDPVRHLKSLPGFVTQGIMLDTHYALDAEATLSYEVEGRSYRYKQYREFGVADPFSGMYDHSKWLTLESIQSILGDAGFPKFDVVETRAERNGPRVLLFAQR
jgi:hypothetical protein